MEETNGSGPACRHHWLLGQPTNGWVAGVCRNCRSERLFPAYLETIERSDELPELQSMARDAAATAGGGAQPSPRTLLVDSES